MPKLRRLAGRDVLTILHGFGFQQVSQRGSDVKLVREITGNRTAHVIRDLVLHGLRDGMYDRTIHPQKRTYATILSASTIPRDSVLHVAISALWSSK